MKKKFTLLLALTLCFALAACSPENNTQTDSRQYDKYAHIFDLLEAGNYEAAHNAINALSPEDQTQIGRDETPNGLSGFTTEEVGSWLIGQWISKNGQTTTLNADGSCTIAGENLTWFIDDVSGEQQCAVRVFRGDRQCYALETWTDDDWGFGVMAVRPVNEDGVITGEQFNYNRATDFTAVEISMDNWQEYFEYKETHAFSENAFGEIELFRLSNYLLNKDDIVIYSGLSDVAVEYTYTYSERELTLDTEARTYTLGEIKDQEEEETTVISMDQLWSLEDAYQYGLAIGGGQTSELTGDTMYYSAFGEILRIQGTIYIINTDHLVQPSVYG